MPIYIRNNCILAHVHIPKCGGSSIKNYLEQVSTTRMLYYVNEKHDFPCNPQHFHKTLLNNIFDDSNVSSFCLVRHPLSRFLSEHTYRNNLRQKRKVKINSLSKDIDEFFKSYAVNEFCYDNHIRPQIEFIDENTKVFKLESQIEEAHKFIKNILFSDEKNEIEETVVVKENISHSDDFMITDQQINKINSFYDFDFKFLGYEKFELNKGESISYFELKRILSRLNSTEYNYDSSVVNNYYRHKSKGILRPLLIRITNKIFKQFANY